MKKYLLLFEGTKKINQFIKLQVLIIGRLLTILFKRRKKLERISFGYYQKWHFNNAYLFLDFRFKNAVWFRIDQFTCYDFSKQLVLDLENIQKDTLNFEVFGFFQKQIYKIHLNKEAQINTPIFKTKIEKINNFELLPHKTTSRITQIGLHIPNITPTVENISVKKQNIKLYQTPFKIEETYEA
jgi:hypothetical protein